jgi:hypothetical protein
MGRRYSDETLAYIKARAIAGETGVAIWRDLTAGKVAELGPLNISKRQVQNVAARFKREHEQSGVDLEPASETAIESELRLLLAETRRRRKAASKLPDTDPKALKLLADCARTMAEVRRHLQSTGKDPAKQAARATPKHRSTLDMLGQAMRDPA